MKNYKEVISDVIDRIKNSFLSNKNETFNEPVYEYNDDGICEFERITISNRFWFTNLSRYLYDTKNCSPDDLLSEHGFNNRIIMSWQDSHSTSLIIKYWKDNNKLQIYKYYSILKYNGYTNKIYYKKIKELIFTISDKGCYTIHKNKPLKLTFNTAFYFPYGKELLDKLYPEFRRFYELDMVPNKFKDFKTISDIIDKIDPDNKLRFIDNNTLIALYTKLTKKSFKLIVKYHKSIESKLKNLKFKYNEENVIYSYYEVKYSKVFLDKKGNNYKISQLIELGFAPYNHEKFNKIELVKLSEIDKYCENKIKNYHSKINNKYNGYGLHSLKGIKRLLNKVWKPTFEFTVVLLETKEQIIEAFNECECDISSILYRKGNSILYKIYYRSETIIYDLTSGYHNYNKYNIDFKKYLDDNVKEQLNSKSKYIRDVGVQNNSADLPL